LPFFDSDAAELSSEIAGHFIELVGTVDLSKINRLAATLVWNTHRRVVEARYRKWWEERHEELPCDYDVVGIPPGRSFDEEVGAIGRWLESIVGRDAGLVIAVAIEGENQREVGKRCGLSHEVARKRYQAAKRRLRDHFRVDEEALSQFDRLDRISGSNRQEAAKCKRR
jgi:RNA polymerase sigma-70 factor (ECF subfamily)